MWRQFLAFIWIGLIVAAFATCSFVGVRELVLP